MITLDEQNRIKDGEPVTMQSLPTTTRRAPDAHMLTKDQGSDLLRATVEAFLKAGKLPDNTPPTQTWLAKQIGMTAPTVSAWLNGSYRGDNDKIERLIGDVLKASGSRLRDSHKLFETPVTMQVNAACERIKKRNRVALIDGDAGIGKTSGIILYCAGNPTVVPVTALKGANNEIAMINGLFRAVDVRHFDRNKGDTRIGTLIKHFKGSNRLIIIDNAHRLTRGGLEFVFDFHDETSCPISFVGNPEVLVKIKENDQMFSRISLHVHITFDGPQKVAMELLSRMCPDYGNDLLPISTQVVNQFGHVRALRYQLEETLDLFNDGKGPFKSIVQAFKAAHTTLVRAYKLN